MPRGRAYRTYRALRGYRWATAKPQRARVGSTSGVTLVTVVAFSDSHCRMAQPTEY